MTDSTPPLTLGVVAPSSAVPQIELRNGLRRLEAAGLRVVLHPQCAEQHFTFAGTDESRCDALWEHATDPSINVIWTARGGYGATRLLPLLDALTARHGPPPRKLLVGYSDITVLHEYVRTRWGWATLHAPMPAASNFHEIRADEFDSAINYVRRTPTDPSWERAALQWMTDVPSDPIRGELVGGNLCLWSCLAGTDYAPSARGKILFFEDLGEAYYRIDRMMTQMVQAGLFDGAAAIVLGDFLDCKDEAHRVAANEDGTEKKLLRTEYGEREAFDEIFGTVGRKLGIPVAYGLPVGHGPNFAPLPLGAQYELSPAGKLRLTEWDWLRP